MGWCGTYDRSINANLVEGDLSPNSFVTVEREDGKSLHFTFAGGAFESTPDVRDRLFIKCHQNCHSRAVNLTERMMNEDKTMNAKSITFKAKWLVAAVVSVTLWHSPMAFSQEQSWTYTYNAQGLKETEDGPRTDVVDVTTYTYDSQGNVASVTNALNQVTTYNSYDAAGRVLSVTDPNGVVTEFQYHPRGWLTQVSVLDPSGGPAYTTNYQYYADGQLETVTQPNGATLTFEYNDANHLTGISNSLGERIDYELDAAGNQTKQTIKSADGTITYSVQTAYDELSRVMDVIGNNGQQDSIDYDANDNPVLTSNARGAQTIQQYDALNRVRKIVDADQEETHFTYDAQDRIQSVTDARGNTTTYEYDGLGNLKSLTSPDTGTATYLYDNAGNRTRSTDARGVVTNYSYDALNRLKTVKYPASPSENITYTYDRVSSSNKGIGRLTKISQANMYTNFYYNHLGQVSKTYTKLNGVSRSVNYKYDATGTLTRATYPSNRYVYYYYDTLGRVTKIKTKVGSTTETILKNIAYLPFGPANEYRYGNNLGSTKAFDLDYRPANIKVTSAMYRYYTYDQANNITRIRNSLNSNANQDYEYDLLNRLISASGLYGELDYLYDGVGNRLNETRNGNTDSYQYADDSNRLLGVSRTHGDRSFSYDAAGNSVTRTADDNSTQNLTYNNANRLSSVSVNGAAVASYTYNPMGQRVAKTLANGDQEIYYYDLDGHLISVYSGTGIVLREYIYWGDQQVAIIIGNNTYFIHNDHLNTPQVVTDINKQVVWAADYEPFGNIVPGVASGIEILSRFPGQYSDEETGLFYNYFRDYDPSLGRYLQSDPIGLAGGINTYAYVGGNPLSFSDPLGLHGESIGSGVGPYGSSATLGRRSRNNPNSYYEPLWDPQGLSHPDKHDVGEARNCKSDDGCWQLRWSIEVLTRDLQFRRWDMQYNYGGGDKPHKDHYLRVQRELAELVSLAKSKACPYTPQADVELRRGPDYHTPWFPEGF